MNTLLSVNNAEDFRAEFNIAKLNIAIFPSNHNPLYVELFTRIDFRVV